ncbi:MAG TPA: hypothetical protein VFJ58_14750, partial [Armatimonadota bacterium]|nr:hypothetical protein [Armatimonadota bacterium]
MNCKTSTKTAAQKTSRRTCWRVGAVSAGIAAMTGALLFSGNIPGLQAASGNLASARQVTINGAPVGEVDVNGSPVLRIRAASGGYSALQRSQIVANRLNKLYTQGKLSNIGIGSTNGQVIVQSQGGEIITATGRSALVNNSSPSQLAGTWAGNLRTALTNAHAYSGSQQLGASNPTLAAEQHNTDKLVPIISVGTGTRVGAALVTGPSNRVAQAAAVGQIEVKWKRIVEARVLVPISNPAVQKGLKRVPEVSVYAVGTYR